MTAPAPARDTSIDLLRAVCTIVVVALHATMAGVVVSGGEVALVNALEQPWFWPASWLVQIMPLFFIAGGVTGAVAFRRWRGAGGTAAGFAANRIRRLLPPGIVAVAVTALGLASLRALGVPSELLVEAGFRISQPLWFLGVFLLVQALLPALLAAHERRPGLTIIALAAGVLAVDIIRLSTGIEAVGYANLALVWLLIQQLGFFLADGRFARASARARVTVAGAALMTTGILAAVGVFSPDMYVNLNPPTIALVLLGVAQVSLFSLAQPALRRIASHGAPAAVTEAVGRRAMGIYLWHMPAIVLLAGGLVAFALVADVDLIPLYDPAWWATRPAWFVAVGALALVLCALAPRVRLGASGSVTLVRAALGSALAVASIAVLFVLGLDVGSAVISVALGLGALRIVSAPARERGKTPAQPVGHPDPALAA